MSATVTVLRPAKARSTAADYRQATATVKAALVVAFPGVAFSVRRGRGTGWGWITVSWTNGPRSVEHVTDVLERTAFPRPRGILCQRSYSDAVRAQAQAAVAAAHPEMLGVDVACNARKILDGRDLTGVR